MRLAATMPRMNICVSSVATQYSLKISGARSATHEEDEPDDPVRREPAARRAHAGRPKSPRGRTASTIASRTNVKMIE